MSPCRYNLAPYPRSCSLFLRRSVSSKRPPPAAQAALAEKTNQKKKASVSPPATYSSCLSLSDGDRASRAIKLEQSTSPERNRNSTRLLLKDQYWCVLSTIPCVRVHILLRRATRTSATCQTPKTKFLNRPPAVTPVSRSASDALVEPSPIARTKASPATISRTASDRHLLVKTHTTWIWKRTCIVLRFVIRSTHLAILLTFCGKDKSSDEESNLPSEHGEDDSDDDEPSLDKQDRTASHLPSFVGAFVLIPFVGRLLASNAEDRLREATRYVHYISTICCLRFTAHDRLLQISKGGHTSETKSTRTLL